VMSSFSTPPMRCSRPRRPGTAHGRASVFGSRRYGWKPFLLGAEFHVEFRQVLGARDLPRLGAVSEVPVGRKKDGGHVFGAMRNASIAMV